MWKAHTIAQLVMPDTSALKVQSSKQGAKMDSTAPKVLVSALIVRLGITVLRAVLRQASAHRATSVG